jgi:hypothetical protein
MRRSAQKHSGKQGRGYEKEAHWLKYVVTSAEISGAKQSRRSKEHEWLIAVSPGMRKS